MGSGGRRRRWCTSVFTILSRSSTTTTEGEAGAAGGLAHARGPRLSAPPPSATGVGDRPTAHTRPPPVTGCPGRPRRRPWARAGVVAGGTRRCSPPCRGHRRPRPRGAGAAGSSHTHAAPAAPPPPPRLTRPRGMSAPVRPPTLGRRPTLPTASAPPALVVGLPADGDGALTLSLDVLLPLRRTSTRDDLGGPKARLPRDVGRANVRTAPVRPEHVG